MPHSLIVGVTLSGKTTLAKMIAKGLKDRGHKIAILDPMKDREWIEIADFSTHNPDAFLAYAKRTKSHFLFVDESGTAIGRYNRAMDWLTTTGRHLGHSVTLICHRTTNLAPTIRDNCTTVYVFAVSEEDSIALAKAYREPSLRNVAKFRQGQFYKVGQFCETQIGVIDFRKRTLKITRLNNGKEAVSHATRS